MNSALPITPRQRVFREIRDYVLIAIGMLMYAIGWTVFLLPNDLPSGAVPGIASIVYWASGIPVQYTYMTINGILLVFSIIILGWKFSMKTIFAVVVLSTVLPIIQAVTNGLSLIHDQPFMACVLGATFCGGGIGVAFTANGSTGGTDIIAAIVNKYRDISLGRVIILMDLVIISSSYLVLHNWEKVVYGFVVLFVSGYVLDQVVNSARQSVQFFIISKKYEEIGKRINKDLHRGVTFIDGVGCYTNNGVKLMFVLAKKSESNTIFRLIKDIDPSAFVSQSAVIGVFGEGFDRIKVK
ncbi:MAG: YitT family protein [Bacteroidales bacterium]|nr:YitT family protein [Bacteroidales bacterium]